MMKAKLVVAAILLAAPAYAAPGGQQPNHVLRTKSCNASSYYRDLFVSLGMARNDIARLDCGFHSPPL